MVTMVIGPTYIVQPGEKGAYDRIMLQLGTLI